MGFFDFLADAGSRILSSDDGQKIETTLPIIKHIETSGVDISNIKTKLEQGVVTLSGYVPNQEQKEKAVLTAGNIAGISGVQDNLILGQPPANSEEVEQAEVAKAKLENNKKGEDSWESGTYTVQPGDTLSKVAKLVYGDAMKYPQIFEANRPMLSDPDKIYPGQVLRIPRQQ